MLICTCYSECSVICDHYNLCLRFCPTRCHCSSCISGSSLVAVSCVVYNASHVLKCRMCPSLDYFSHGHCFLFNIPIRPYFQLRHVNATLDPIYQSLTLSSQSPWLTCNSVCQCETFIPVCEIGGKPTCMIVHGGICISIRLFFFSIISTQSTINEFCLLSIQCQFCKLCVCLRIIIECPPLFIGRALLLLSYPSTRLPSQLNYSISATHPIHYCYFRYKLVNFLISATP